ncbi:hypothetical protein M441DRAFT_62531 [Trichoderma asperellum CBS 433.97]|uniref:Protein kinase domain-containing protein n=1 Tax=Trichoderma asperellum (strain ATCC 204424 / CBS 433.97 / NBRC 101777) TaxID=1042311 RepID=A0A2T3YTA2_TRIA4|nr:hypothetical protein M441DRAFT_62531 [Trichoderma asperellum CBS 433.97]PTB35798.1 hypothetical protein M441DRAFT_62531 [Trichoderma asperellum CBS 433.97]
MRPGGGIFPGGPSDWYVLDWDQRRTIAVTMDEEQESPDVAIGHLKRHIDTLGPDVCAIHLSQDGELISVSTKPEDDQTTCVYYPPLQHVECPSHVKTVLRSDLIELDRFGPNTDLVSYIPGGTLSQNKSRVFKLEWLRQLTSVVDDLNLKHGIAHQDISARNLLVEPKTNALMLFDFNYSGRIGGIGYGEDRDDVKGVIFTLYEIITRDAHFRDVRHSEQNPADVQGLEEWVKHPDVKLDHPVSEYRAVLNDWVDKRQAGRRISHYTEAPEYIDWPEFPEPPAEDVALVSTTVKWVLLERERRHEREKGNAILNWERPAQSKLGGGHQLLANGQYASGTERLG